MPTGLWRFNTTGGLHFLTFSCYRRQAFLASPSARDCFERSLEQARVRYRFYVAAYVVMPEHVHLLLTAPENETLAAAMQAIKQSVSRKLIGDREHFWQARYYDFNVWSREKRIEKLKYIHRNPVRRGLVERPEDWAWSSFRHYQTGEHGRVEIESHWTEYYRAVARRTAPP